MPKAQNIQATRKRHKKILKRAKGYFGNKSRLYRYAKDQVEHSLVYAYRDRKKNKSNFRSLWILRINAACRNLGIPYSRFMNALKKAGIEMDRKALSNLAVQDEAAFTALVEKVRVHVSST
ncbi:MAG: 50S ribosomal protein L20 [Opitutales bacterium]|jgi:large subunit ribosomal protein L20